MRILIVDGSAAVRASLREFLVDIANVELVGMAADARTMLKLVAALKPDVVIVDVHLLDANAIGILQTIKETRPSPSVIGTTIYSYGDEHRRAYLMHGADFFLNKAVEFEKIPVIVQALMRPSRVQPATNQLQQCLLPETRRETTS